LFKQVLVAFFFESIMMKCYMVLCLCMLVISCRVSLGNMKKKTMHDEFKNRFSFVEDEKSIALVSLTFKEVYQDQLKLKKENMAKKRVCM